MGQACCTAALGGLATVDLHKVQKPVPWVLTLQHGRNSGMQGGQGVVDTVGGTCPPPRQQGVAHGHPLSCSWGRAIKSNQLLGTSLVRKMNSCQ